jgi:two-component system phosphate regulon sensor histidine kinase PhoR
MTHEFKTPLSTIAISAKVLAESPKLTEDDRLNKYLEIIVQENNQLKKQVDKLLQMTDLEKDKIELKLEELDLHEFIASIAGHLELRVNEAKGELKLDLKASPCSIQADRVHLTNILYNLLDNALKYTEGPPKINVSTSVENGVIQLSVSDNGLGIEEVQQKKIFDKFYRVPTGNVHDVKGFGLGLSYIAKLTEAHYWKLKLKSALGQGSTFTILIKH